MNTLIPSLHYLGILVQGGAIFYFLINAIFLIIIMPQLQPKRNEATVAIHKSLAVLLLIYLANYALWIIPELLQDLSGYYQIARVYPNYNTFMEYMDLAILPLSMVFGSTVLLGRLPNKWTGISILVPYLLYAFSDIYQLLPFKLYQFAYITTILATAAQLAWYGYFSRRFEKKLLNNCSNIDRRSTRWVFWTLVPLFLLSLLYVPLSVITATDEWMILYDFLTLLFLTGIVGRALSHKVDDMTMDLIKEQLEEIKAEKQGEIQEPEVTEPTSTNTPANVPTTTESTTGASTNTQEGNPAVSPSETSAETKPTEATTIVEEPSKGNNLNKFANFDETIQKLEEDQFYLDTEVNIDWISSQLGTNRHYVSDYLNQIKHVTFYEYVNTLRLKHAEQLLKERKEKVADIAFISGFNNDHTFRRLFKEKYGCTPLQYQKSL